MNLTAADALQGALTLASRAHKKLAPRCDDSTTTAVVNSRGQANSSSSGTNRSTRRDGKQDGPAGPGVRLFEAMLAARALIEDKSRPYLRQGPQRCYRLPEGRGCQGMEWKPAG